LRPPLDSDTALSMRLSRPAAAAVLDSPGMSRHRLCDSTRRDFSFLLLLGIGTCAPAAVEGSPVGAIACCVPKLCVAAAVKRCVLRQAV
jgi:hypothetical protein